MKSFYLLPLCICLLFGLNANAQVSADFSTDQTIGCDAITVKFTDLSTDATGWSWNFGNGTTSTTQNPTVTFDEPGTYTVSLKASDAFGSDTETKSALITVLETPQVSFTLDQDFGCNSLSIAPINGTSLGTNRTYAWDFGDGSSSTDRSPSHSYSVAGNYTVALAVVESGMCTSSSVEASVTVEELVADFSVPTNICLNATFEVTDLTAGTVDSYFWRMGDGTAYSASGPSHAYTQTGTKTITVEVETATGCISEKSTTVTVLDLPTPAINNIDIEGCVTPFTASLSDQSTSPNGSISSIVWNAAGIIGTENTFNPTIDNYGFHRLDLDVTDELGCTNGITLNKHIKVFRPEIKINASSRSGCKPLSTVFTDQSLTNSGTITGWNWVFGNGDSSTEQNPTTTYADTGSFDISLTITTDEGCSNTQTFSDYVVAGQPPTGTVAASDPFVCQDASVLMTNSVDAFTDYWLWGRNNTGGSINLTTEFNSAAGNAGNWTFTESDTGYFDVELKPSFHGCEGDVIALDSAYRILVPISVINVSQEIACEAPLQLTIDESSIGADSYLWNLGIPNASGTGDSLINTQDLPQPFTYEEQGVYNLTLQTTALSFGKTCTNTDVVKIGVAQTQPLIVDFTAPVSGCSPLDVPVESGSISNTPINTVTWWIGDSGSEHIGSGQQTTLTATTPGFHDLTLVIVDSLGCEFSTTIVDAMEVKGLPTPGYTVADTSQCTNDVFTFTSTATGAAGAAIVASAWQFGDDSTSTASSPTHAYSNRGIYNVQLSVTDEFGCIDSIIKNGEIVVARPYVSFTTNKDVICNDQAIDFTPVVSILNDSNQYAMNWSFGDGNLSTDTTTSHVYELNADTTQFIIVTVTATNLMYGCDSAITDTIEISIPQALFAISDSILTCYPDTATFTNQSSQDVVSWAWDLGAGHTSIDTSASAVYTEPDTVDIQLIVLNHRGCKDTTVVTSGVEILGPTGSYAYQLQSETCERGYQFTVMGTHVDSAIWMFDDGIGGTEAYGDTVYYYFIEAKSYNPTVTLVDTSTGCEQTLTTPSVGTAQIDIPESDAFADFSISNVYPDQGETIVITDLSTSANGEINQISWNLGDSTLTFTESQDIQHSYADPGNYTLSVTITDEAGCTDVNQQSIDVLEAFQGYNVMTPNGDGVNDCIDIELYGTTRYNLQIFNRAGQLVYESICVYDVAWCGENLDGDIVPNGTYYYLAKTVDISGEFNNARGFISVMGGSGN